MANAQEADAPEGAIIDAVEISGFSLYSLSPGLQKDINSLVGSPLNRERLNPLASRIEEEQPEVVAAVRSVSRPDGKARVIFLVARISDDTDLTEKHQRPLHRRDRRHRGPCNEVSQQLRDDLQKLVGRRLDTDEAERLQERLEDELPGRDVAPDLEGSQTGRDSGRLRDLRGAVDSFRADAIEAGLSRPAGLERRARYPDVQLTQPSSVHSWRRVQRHRRADRGVLRVPARVRKPRDRDREARRAAGVLPLQPDVGGRHALRAGVESRHP